MRLNNNAKHKLFNSFNSENHRSFSHKDIKRGSGLDSTRNRASYLRHFGRDISNIQDSKSFADNLPASKKYLQSKKPTLPHPGMSSRGAENVKSTKRNTAASFSDRPKRATRVSALSKGAT